MIVAIFIGIVLLSVAIGLAVTIVYVKALSIIDKRYGEQIRAWLSRRLPPQFFTNVRGQRGYSRKDSKIEVWCINSFDNVQKWSQSKVMVISRVIHYFGWKSNVSKDGYNQDGDSCPKHCYGDVERSLHNEANLLHRGKRVNQK